MLKLTFWLLQLICGAAIAVASNGVPLEISISQSIEDGAYITAYIAVMDETEAAVSNIEAEDISATIGSHPAQVLSSIPFAGSKEGIAYIFLVDISKSISAKRFEQIRKALRHWVDELEPQDQAAIISFGSKIQTRMDFSHNSENLKSIINQLAPTDQNTALYQALMQGMVLGRQQAVDLPDRRAIVILSDGLDDATSGITEQEVIAQTADGTVPIYAIGFSSVEDKTQREVGLKALGRFAHQSGGVVIEAGHGDLADSYLAIKRRINEVYMVKLYCADCILDGNSYRLQLSLHSGGITLSNGVDLRLYPSSHSQEAPKTNPQNNPQNNPQTNPKTTHNAPLITTALQPTTTTPSQTLWRYATISIVVILGAIVLLWWQISLHRKPVIVEPVESEYKLDTAPLASGTHFETTPMAAAIATPPSPKGRSLRVAFMNGPQRGQEVLLNISSLATIGRSSTCSLAISGDEEISNNHAQLTIEGKHIVITDLGSTNGTWLNGVTIRAPTPVVDGDVLKIGQTRLYIVGC